LRLISLKIQVEMKAAAVTILDGNRISAEIKAEVAAVVRALTAAGRRPGLAAILAGDHHPSEIYVRNKSKACEELGIYIEKLSLPSTLTTEELLSEIAQLNARDEIDGILVQLPLPPHIDAIKVLEAVSPEKDVDGFHPFNVGRLVKGTALLPPCTPAGIIELLRRSHIPIAGKHAVVLGRSHVVGRPMALLLLNNDATVTVCHSKSVNAAELARQGDILIAAIGQPAWVTEDFIKPGATVIDVGINRVTDREQFQRIFAGHPAREKSFREKGFTTVGDVHPRVAEVAGAITPVPGGVGPLTIAMLMSNTVRACMLRHGGGDR
jgi:methylenetetrahydrofolate dehydrogenase (NADP+) / methenyltetrahydrofolate cyclohydrolase